MGRREGPKDYGTNGCLEYLYQVKYVREWGSTGLRLCNGTLSSIAFCLAFSCTSIDYLHQARMHLHGKVSAHACFTARPPPAT